MPSASGQMCILPPFTPFMKTARGLPVPRAVSGSQCLPPSPVPAPGRPSRRGGTRASCGAARWRPGLPQCPGRGGHASCRPLSLLSQTSPPARGPVRCYLFLSCFREEIETLTKKFQELEETKKEEEGGPVEVTPEVRLRLLGRGWDAVTLMAPTPGVSRRAHGRFRFLLSSAAFCKLRVLNPKSWANGVCGRGGGPWPCAVPGPSTEPGVLVPAGPGPGAPGLWWRERALPLTLCSSSGLSRGGYALTSAAALGSGAEVLRQRWPPRACLPGVGSAEPARAAVTHTRTADGPVFPQPPCDPCSVTPSAPEGLSATWAPPRGRRVPGTRFGQAVVVSESALLFQQRVA